jgi:hypothetical protein
MGETKGRIMRTTVDDTEKEFREMHTVLCPRPMRVGAANKHGERKGSREYERGYRTAREERE